MRTYSQIVSDVIREVRGQCTPLEAQQAVADALDGIDSKANWEFLITKTLININASYTTGLVYVSAKSNGVGSAGTTFWTNLTALPYTPSYLTIKLASRQLPYEVQSISNDNLLFMTTPISGTTGISSAGSPSEKYSIYQMRYALPADCEPGRDLKLKGPFGTGEDGNGEIKKIGNLTFERRRQDYGVSPSGPYWYTDGPYDEVNKVPTILMWPYPNVAQEFRLTYYRKLTIPTTMAANIMLPQAFERLPIMLAASQIMQNKTMQGWLEKKTMAEKMMSDLYNRYAASPAYDGSIEPDDGGAYEKQFAANNTLFTGFGNY